ncbi:MAG TPA: hypothetical protein DDX14_05335, partial [Cyanobacteria bacterium UBA9579]|nr:hypothetical protein [Cyanobacteria bacterium UBA9579]
PNHPGSQNCRKCNYQLLRKCSGCRSLNYVKDLKCAKCSKAFAPAIQIKADSSEINKQESGKKSQSKTEMVALSFELVNLDQLKAKLDSDDLIIKLQKKFQQIIVNEAKKNAKAVRKISNQLLAVEYKADSAKISAVYAIVAAQRVLENIDDLNHQLQSDYGVILEVKASISIVNPDMENDFAKFERTIAQTGDIVVADSLHNLVSEMFDFDEIENTEENSLITFYKLKDNQSDTEQDSTSVEELHEVAYQQDAQSDKKKPAKQGKEVFQAREKLRKNSELFEHVGRKEVSQEEAYNIVNDIITKEKKGAVIGIAGEDGIGKSTVLSSIRQSLLNEKIIWLVGICQPINQLVPFAFFQDLLKTLLNLPMYTLNVVESQKLLNHALDNLGIKDSQTISVLNRLLFQDSFTSDISRLSDIQFEVYESIKAIFTAINTKEKIVLLIEDLESIDIASAGCIKYLIDSFLLDNNNHIIVTCLPDISLSNYFFSPNHNNRIICLHLNKMAKDEMNKALLGMLNNQDIVPDELKEQIFQNAKGFPIYIEQVLWYLFQSKAICPENNVLQFNAQAKDIKLPETVEDIIKLRLSQISSLSFDSSKVMLAASLFGQKSMLTIIQLMLGIQADQLTNLMQMLLANGIFVNFDNYSIMFKHKLIWKVVYSQWNSDEQKMEYHKQALDVLRNYTKVSASILAIHAELANHIQEAIDYWRQSAVEAASVGDTQVYIAAQKQILGLLDKIESSDEAELDRVKRQIHEQIGKISYENNPQEAVEYLSNAIIEREKNADALQVIELTGYLSKSCELLGNYTGVIECVDKALSGIDEQQFPVETALLYYSKLEALFNLGKLEETCVIARTKVIPVLKEFIETDNAISGLGEQELSYIEIDTELVMAKALAIQGNKEAINIVNTVINKAKILEFIDIEVKARIVEALCRALQGRTKSANTSLSYLKDIIPYVKDKTLVKLYWDFVTVIIKILNGNYNQAGNLCCSLQPLAQECREYNILAIIKLLFAKTLKETGSVESAKAVYNDIIAYCSEYKIATGALLGWYLIAETELANDNILAAEEIAQRAHEVAQKAEINNHFFLILLKGIIAEAQVVKGNFESARMHVEQALELAKSMELYFLQAELYLIYGNIFRKIIELSESRVNKEKNANNAYKLYMSALDIAKMIENDYITAKIQKELTNLAELCGCENTEV